MDNKDNKYLLNMNIKADVAIAHALEIRKFEIENYWRRAGYFWALIGAAFAGYFIIFKEPNGNQFVLSTISSVGMVFSFAWYCVNRGSKYWQENWENHVDLLEDDIIGPLYKTVTETVCDGKGKNIIRHLKGVLIDPKALSVSKINQIVSLFIFLIWVALVFISLFPAKHTEEIAWGCIVVVSMGVITCIVIPLAAKTNIKDKLIKSKTRKVKNISV